jgi:signal-transduction protein with cAMP-binding, CBS, and nucleotidyltransferase domain
VLEVAVKIRDLMSVPPVMVPSVTPVRQVAAHMDFDGVGCVLVVDDERLVGLVTDRDLTLRVLARGLSPDLPVGSVMSHAPVTVRADEDVSTVVHMLRHHAVRRLPVMIGDVVVGIVTIDDLLLETSRLQQDLISPVTNEILDPQHQR